MEPIETFSKQIKSKSVSRKTIPDESTISKIVSVLGKLENQQKAVTSKVENIGLKTNPKNWVSYLLDGYPDSIEPKDVENLLFDFTESMQTRMRMDTKYALALIMDNRVFLAHSVYGQETITPDWRIIPRMLDVDNVLRFASFFMTGDELKVRYWERNATSSFIEWLGLPRKQAYQFGGKFRILSSIECATFELQLTEDEISGWIDSHPEMVNGKISFASPIHGLTITEIRSGTKTYNHPEDFIQDFEAQKQGLPRYQREYEAIRSKMLPMFVKYYDEKHQLVVINDDQVNIEVEKSTPGIDVIFSDDVINLRASYRNELVTRILNGDEINVFHAAHDFSMKPISIGRVNIYNQLSIDSVFTSISNYIKNTKIKDQQLDIVLKLAGFLALSSANKNLAIRFAINQIAEGILEELNLIGTLSKLEDGVVEYKSRDIFHGKNNDVIKTLAEDIKTALKDSDLSIHLVGVGDDGTVDPIPSNRINSDRLDLIRNGIANELRIKPPHISAISADGGSIVMICTYENL